MCALPRRAPSSQRRAGGIVERFGARAVRFVSLRHSDNVLDNPIAR
jgi:hypothetical protein